MPLTRIAVLGAGAWGTALAIHLARRGPVAVALWARDPTQSRSISERRENVRYLPGIALPETLRVTSDLASLGAPELLIVATPVAALCDVVAQLPAALPAVPLFWLSKGFMLAQPGRAIPAGVELAHQVIAPSWTAPVGVISGPSFAEEVARELPTAVTVAGTDSDVAEAVAHCLRAQTLRAYVTDDLVGVEVAGAVKNVLAIAAGASDGLGFGHNARAALITRGLAETDRLSHALGGRRETLMGLAGLGDLVLTCTGDLSRNRRVGLALGQGLQLDEILRTIGHVAEGVPAAKAVRSLARHHGVEMPICEAVCGVLHEGVAVRAAVQSLLQREPRAE
ncbi:MAG: NAD(P)-dependent glycerol-3-phosphate dehydrogenase [Pseudomonadota bacterium]|nr:NAD(P)-dependent glycerol-3-phosphate dehydrogenase [Pseudomonadota bacterium]